MTDEQWLDSLQLNLLIAVRQMVTGRFSQPTEVAAAVVFLAGDLVANITGADIRIDGGLVPTW